MISLTIQVLIVLVVSLVAAQWIFPKVLNVAHSKNIVDNPDARKLQRRPVPVLGGACVFFGLTAGIATTYLMIDCAVLMPVLFAVVIMFGLGTLDDIIELSPKMRFIIEILVVLMIFCANGLMIDHFHGLWGVERVPTLVAVLLTIVAAVGIINAINLIDGVDGLSTGYCITASLLFGIMAWRVGDTTFLMLAVVSIGALFPFFMHNVFGKNSKMFIGDGGTLVMGVIMSAFVTNLLGTNSVYASLEPEGVGLIPFTLAVLAVPVFDTLRVMAMRMLRGNSPFKPDKTHLHHLFIELGFSHVGTTISILLLNLFVVAMWYLAYILGLSIDVQLYVVVALAIGITFGFYGFMKWQMARNGAVCRMMQRIGKASHVERKGLFMFLQRFVDLGCKEIEEPAAEEVAPAAPNSEEDENLSAVG